MKNEIRARLEAATPGPWEVTTIGKTGADGDFLFHAREDIAYLLAEVDRLEAENEQLRRERDAAAQEIFNWVGCPACKHFDTTEEQEWCSKHDREVSGADGCESPEWRGPAKEGG